EHIELSTQQDGGIPLVVELLEMLGADNLAHGRWGKNKMVVRLPHSVRPERGSTLWLQVPPQALHFFDHHGQRIE
ncbi:MAG TPA: sn-glycerol-3-phosphate ABC transporter ATP-binding protein UgpC, partial [Erwinia persicina]|nr:sn-glycerol-3-phosphate ABC transporter ATP-binding protein UgpC [Erwinia persicina]